MYTANKRQRRQIIFFRFVLYTIPFLIALAVLGCLIFLRGDNSSASFVKSDSTVATVQPKTTDFTNEFFKIALPSTWVFLGRQNPFSNQVYYEYQNKQKDYDNRWLRVYVDVFPSDYAVTRLLPLTVSDNRLIPGNLSDDCNTFTGAPIANSSQSVSVNWAAKWQNINFTCDMSNQQTVGTASLDEGYGVTIVSQKGVAHKYFFVYIDHNIHPDYSLISNAVKSFQAQ
jgi:hypothetical protein